jgi:hypothetical protein
LEANVLHIFQHISQNQRTDNLVLIAAKLCESIAIFTALHLTELRTIGLHRLPADLINNLCSFAHLWRNTLNFYGRSAKEEFLYYCASWSDTTPGEIERTVAALANLQYNHININDNIVVAVQ